MLSFRRTAPGIVSGEIVETPLELARMPDRWHQLFGSALPLGRATVVRFARQEIAPGVTLYSAGCAASTLVVGFSGRWLRLMLPVAGILQNLDETRFDLLLLTDSTRGHFRNGIGDFADSFHALCRNIDGLRASLGHRHLVFYGTSMGALPALRASALVDADRAVALGARFAWDISRVRNAKRRADAFDPLCNCRPVGNQAHALFSRNVPEDAVHAEKLLRVMPDCQVLGVEVSDHNILFPLLRRGRLDVFQRMMLDPNNPVDMATVEALFDVPGIAPRAG